MLWFTFFLLDLFVIGVRFVLETVWFYMFGWVGREWSCVGCLGVVGSGFRLCCFWVCMLGNLVLVRFCCVC